MLTLFHHPFCPHSRFVRLALAEYGADARLVEEQAWERRQEFLILNPAGADAWFSAVPTPPIELQALLDPFPIAGPRILR